MDAHALTLARAGYVSVSVSFNFKRHGDNPCLISGDVTRIEGTTSKLMVEISRIVDWVLELDHIDGRLAGIGHAMTADIITQQIKSDERLSTIVAILMFSHSPLITCEVRLSRLLRCTVGASRRRSVCVGACFLDKLIVEVGEGIPIRKFVVALDHISGSIL